MERTKELIKKLQNDYFITNLIEHNLNSNLLPFYKKTLSCNFYFQKDLCQGEKKNRLCKNRWCKVCKDIRSDKLIKKYLKFLKSFNEPVILKFSILAQVEELSQKLDIFEKRWNNILQSPINRTSRAKGIKKIIVTPHRVEDSINSIFSYKWFTLIKIEIVLDNYEKAEWLFEKLKEGKDESQMFLNVPTKSLIAFLKSENIFIRSQSKFHGYFSIWDSIFNALKNRKMFQYFGETR